MSKGDAGGLRLVVAICDYRVVFIPDCLSSDSTLARATRRGPDVKTRTVRGFVQSPLLCDVASSRERLE